MPKIQTGAALEVIDKVVNKTRKIRAQDVGILLRGKGLDRAYNQMTGLDRRLNELIRPGASSLPASASSVRQWGEARNLVLIARLVTFAASRRLESRGAHYRNDYPARKPEWRRQQSLTVASLGEAH